MCDTSGTERFRPPHWGGTGWGSDHGEIIEINSYFESSG